MSAPLRRGYADIAAGQIHYRHRPGTGTPVLFLHQSASSGAMWERVIARWSAPHPLYALDTPGFGGSFDPEGPLRIDDYAGWLLAAADALGIGRCHLIGHHTGSAIALQIAVDHPARVASVAMIGLSCADAVERAELARLGRAFRPVRSGAYLLKNWEYLRVGGADADVMLLHRELIDQLRAWAARPQAYDAAAAQDTPALLAALNRPAIAIAARDDILFPALTRIAALRPDIAQAVLAGGANFEPDLVPDALTPILLDHVVRAEVVRADPPPA